MTWDDASAKRLGDALRLLRTDKGLTQEALAYQAGITKNQVQLIESGRSSGRKEATGPSNPRISTLAGLAGVLEDDALNEHSQMQASQQAESCGAARPDLSRMQRLIMTGRAYDRALAHALWDGAGILALSDVALRA